jgi:hypothetical protein
MPYMKQLPSGKWVVYDDKGKLVIITRDKRICQNYIDKQQTEKE